jgi:hypothetical protein
LDPVFSIWFSWIKYGLLCFVMILSLFQTANSVLSRCRDHSPDRCEAAIHLSVRLQYIQLSYGDHQSVYISILSTQFTPWKLLVIDFSTSTKNCLFQ